MVSYHVQYQKKLMILSWENLVMNEQVDRQMDKSDSIWGCPTNVEHPKMCICLNVKVTQTKWIQNILKTMFELMLTQVTQTKV